MGKKNKKTIGFALVGCGRISRKHSEIIGGGKLVGAELIAVCDNQFSRAQEVGKKYGVDAFESISEMLEKKGSDIDAVCVLTPSGFHAKHCIEITKYKKHVVVEKPMALTLDDADAMIHACDKSGVKLFVVKQNRYNLPVQKLKEAMDQGRFGKIVMGTVRVRWCRRQEYYDMDDWRGTWSLDGGVFTNQASHHVDLLDWLLGEPESVFAKSRTALVSTETEDTGVAIVKFRSGALGVIEATTATRPRDLEGSISILGEKGSAEIGGFAVNEMKTWEFDEGRSEDKDILSDYSENPPNVYGYGHATYLQRVVESIRDNTPGLVDGLEGRKSLELITAIYESIETGKEVLLRFKPQKCRLGLDD